MAQMVGSRGTYDYLTQYDSYNYNGYATVDAIVVHHWGVDGQNFYNVISALSGSRQASAHYVLQDSLVACIIAPKLRAWHVAQNQYYKVMSYTSDINSHTVGIECRPEFTAGDKETLCQLIADLWYDYGEVPVYGHEDFMPTACPGRYYMQLEDIEARAREIYNSIKNGSSGTVEKPAEQPEEVVEDMTREEVQQMIDAAHRTYATVDDLPMGKDVVQRLIDQGYLVGEGTNADGKTVLNMSYDMLRVICTLDRTGAFKQKSA